MTAQIHQKQSIRLTGPVIFGIRNSGNDYGYHVAGSDKLTESIAEATRYPTTTGETVLRLDSIPGHDSIPFCLALVEILEVTENYTRARWGIEEAIIPTANYHTATYCAIRNRLKPFVRIGGGSYGSNVRYGSIHEAKEETALFDIAFQLPDDDRGLVNVSNPRGSRPFPPLPVTAEDRLGLRSISFKCCDPVTDWFRIFKDRFSLHLESGFGADRKSIRLESFDSPAVSFGLHDSGFGAVLPGLLEFIPEALKSDRATARNLFISIFSRL